MKFPLSCVVCGKDNARGITCFDCRRETSLRGLLSIGSYSYTPLRRGIHWLKFKGVKDLSYPLAKLLIPHLKLIAPLVQLQKEAVLIPVPLHRRRLRQRGFNQSLEIAQVLGQYTGIPVMDVLVRQKPTWTQTKLPSKLREENVNNAFVLKEINKLKNMNLFIIVDDVATTSSTLSAAAKPLRDIYGKKIWGAVIARG
jgi:ComF family protein